LNLYYFGIDMNPMTITSPRFATPGSAHPLAAVDDILDVLFDVSSHSESLMAVRHPGRAGGCDFDIPKFMLLGQRGGGKPIRIALLAGVDDHGSLDGLSAIARLLMQTELNPSLARDYAIFAYPLVDVFEFQTPEIPLDPFYRRYAEDRADGDVRFFRAELRKWGFDGIVTLRTDPRAEGFHAIVRSELIANEVIRPALGPVGRVTAVNDRPIKLRPGDLPARIADAADGRLTPPPDVRPRPFEVELFAPGNVPKESRVSSLFVATHEILRQYRRLISYAADI
jgi:hypothetical protein